MTNLNKTDNKSLSGMQGAGVTSCIEIAEEIKLSPLHTNERPQILKENLLYPSNTFKSNLQFLVFLLFTINTVYNN